MKKIGFIILSVLIIGSVWVAFLRKDAIKLERTSSHYKDYVAEALVYCQTKNINTEFFILIDFSVHSGKKRMYLYDFKKDSITHRFLASHGCGKSATGMDFSRTNPIFSNEPDSHCSSLGKYLVGKNKVKSTNYGEKYLLYGQDETNNNAIKRNIVLHPWRVMPDFEPYPRGVPESWGCPAVSETVFEELHQKLQTSDKNTLLWIIYPK